MTIAATARRRRRDGRLRYVAALALLAGAPIAGYTALLTGAVSTRLNRGSTNHIAAVAFALAATALWGTARAIAFGCEV
jgi:hypothetical protein